MKVNIATRDFGEVPTDAILVELTDYPKIKFFVCNALFSGDEVEFDSNSFTLCEYLTGRVIGRGDTHEKAIKDFLARGKTLNQFAKILATSPHINKEV